MKNMKEKLVEMVSMYVSDRAIKLTEEGESKCSYFLADEVESPSELLKYKVDKLS